MKKFIPLLVLAICFSVKISAQFYSGPDVLMYLTGKTFTKESVGVSLSFSEVGSQLSLNGKLMFYQPNIRIITRNKALVTYIGITDPAVNAGLIVDYSSNTLEDRSNGSIYTYNNSFGQNKSAILSAAGYETKDDDLTKEGGKVKDIDDNEYHTITIGSQVWMMENLNTTIFRNGDPIPNVTDGKEWNSIKTGAYCNFENITNHNPIEGRLYNWYAVADKRNIAPIGWHVATKSEWETLINYIGGNESGYKLNENSIGFKPIPISERNFGGFSNSKVQYAHWWSSTKENSSLWSILLILGNSSYSIGNGTINGTDNISKNHGFSVRCVRDKQLSSDASSINSKTNLSAQSIKNNTATPNQVVGLQNNKEQVGEIYLAVEKMPEFPGGEKALIEYVNKPLNYPKEAKEKNIEGKVYVRFIVEKDGSISNIKIERGSNDQSLDNEALRMIKILPKWTPGVQDGNPVRVQLTIPVNFKLDVEPLQSKNENNTESQTVNDIDGNLYNTIKIGTQVWMVENLKTTKYNDGTAIPNVTGDTDWPALTTGAYCWYNNDASGYKDVYGALYNWHTVNTGKLAPSGWHVPTDAEWTILIDFLGGEIKAGSKLKETGTNHWRSPNSDANNETGFTALPAGTRLPDNGIFYGNIMSGFWWSSSERGTKTAWYLKMNRSSSSAVKDGNNKEGGFSVRCIRDN